MNEYVQSPRVNATFNCSNNSVTVNVPLWLVSGNNPFNVYPTDYNNCSDASYDQSSSSNAIVTVPFGSCGSAVAVSYPLSLQQIMVLIFNNTAQYNKYKFEDTVKRTASLIFKTILYFYLTQNNNTSA